MGGRVASYGQSEGAPHVAVAVLTYRRPDALRLAMRSVLPQLAEIQLPATLLVVDNEPTGGARHVVAEETVPGSAVRYVHEPCPGISAARNAALRTASDFDVLLFLDDDETAKPGWLAELVRFWRAHRAAAVTGPVEPIFTGSDSMSWMARTGAFDRTRRPTGTRREGFATNNLLLDLSFLRQHQLGFADELGLIGGEDTLLSRQIVACGGVILWCDEAVVSEVVARDRLSGRWVRRRAFRSGASWAHAVLAVEPPARRRQLVLRMWARAAVRVPWGSVQWFAGHVLRRPRLAGIGRDTVLSVCGAVWGARGGSLNEYGRPSRVGG